MRISLLLSALLVCGCAAPRHQAKSPLILPTSIFDDVLTKPQYADAIREAERDLPADRWVAGKGRSNVSRSERECAVVSNILSDLRPTLHAMSATELVRALKVVPYPDGLFTNDFSTVRQDLYQRGNFAISKEIKSRPDSELTVLAPLADDHFVIWTGPDGSVTTLGAFVEYEVHEKR
jgi:hypothetical protein